MRPKISKDSSKYILRGVRNQCIIQTHVFRNKKLLSMNK